MIRNIIIKLVILYYKIRYILTGKTRKDALIKKIKEQGGTFVKYKKKQKRSGRYQKAPSVKKR